MKQTNNNGTTAAQVETIERKEKSVFRFELWATPSKKIEAPRCGLLWNGVTREHMEAVALGMVIGLKEKYQSPRVMLYQQNQDGTETLIREQR